MNSNIQKMPQTPVPRRAVYGVYGLTEWQVLIPAGRAKVSIRFTGGSLSGYGIVPATFATSNPYIQRLVQNSPEFRSRRIRLIECR